ncbi:MAG: hypothetical protein KatS3mg131_0574 [Candidatus Tectimicrobiota bacterium]|nr:MAG: hypothetical protein KatS3mg131_0574 [Candidatus Tectomicrobia bacterium]
MRATLVEAPQRDAAGPLEETYRKHLFALLPQGVAPAVRQALWRQALASYLHNPLPLLAKERLFAYLSRYCATPACLIYHSHVLHTLGTPTAEVCRLLQEPPPVAETDCKELLEQLAAHRKPLRTWPPPEAPLAWALHWAAVLVFVRHAAMADLQRMLKQVLGDRHYASLILFLSYVDTVHRWAEAAPVATVPGDPRVQAWLVVLAAQEPRLAEFFGHYRTFVQQEQAPHSGAGPRISALLRRVKQLERLNAELARRNADLDEFVYMVSHDLQQPLRQLVAFSEQLPRDLGEDLPPRAAQDVCFITAAATRLHRLVQDLLALARAGRTAMQWQLVSLDACVERALDALRGRLQESGAVVQRDPLPAVLGDATLLTQLYQNLIENALKFVNGRRPHIRLTAQQHGRWIFGVQDNGIGVPPAHAEEIFLPFKRLHDSATYPGSGIGLAICRQVVERHGGRIWVESHLGQGAHFRFTLNEDLQEHPHGAVR